MGWPEALDPPASTSKVAGITGLDYHANCVYTLNLIYLSLEFHGLVNCVYFMHENRGSER
jgi:hypothetical protein